MVTTVFLLVITDISPVLKYGNTTLVLVVLTLQFVTGAHGQFDDSIGVYSFALKPEEHQPSGTCNFSRIDNAQLISTSAGVN